MHTWSCGYGVTCRFHHPDPVASEVSNPFTSTRSGMHARGHSLGNHKSESYTSLPNRPSVLDAASVSSDKISLNTVPRLGGRSSHARGMQSLPEQIPLKPQWRCQQTADVPTNNLEQSQGEEYLELSDQPECIYFAITGNCKYKSACRNHHPKDQASKFPVCALNSKGLPLRPDKRMCRYYEQFGLCKLGLGCLYGHPEN